MCKRIITHRMHHDVAAAMIIDPVSPNPMVYANPLRTNFHRCELTLPHNSWAPINHARCQYHTCCIPHERVEYCADHPEISQKQVHFEPEECDVFVLEHHHERLPYFGNTGPYHIVIPATWRPMVRIRGSDAELFPGYTPRLRASFEGVCFAECEKLYTLYNDTLILYASLRDLRANEAAVRKSEEKLRRQRRLVSDMWASMSYNALLNLTRTDSVVTTTAEKQEQEGKRTSRPVIATDAIRTKSKAMPAQKQTKKRTPRPAVAVTKTKSKARPAQKQKIRRSSRLAAAAKAKKISKSLECRLYK
ncbi:hypothetical protein F4679DRAFT_592223 [Xylaria curta]|nr:hypothetical protein F4679DRAFT_592223 [Xylaria curta]